MSRQYFLDFTEVAHVSQHCDLYCTAPVCRLGCRLPGQPNTWCCRAAWEPDKRDLKAAGSTLIQTHWKFKPSKNYQKEYAQPLQALFDPALIFAMALPACPGQWAVTVRVGSPSLTGGMAAPAIGPGPGTQHPSDSWHVTKSHCYAVRVTVPGHTVKSIDWAPASGTTVTLPQAKGPESSRTKNQEVRTILFLFLPIH